MAWVQYLSSYDVSKEVTTLLIIPFIGPDDLDVSLFWHSSMHKQIQNKLRQIPPLTREDSVADLHVARPKTEWQQNADERQAVSHCLTLENGNDGLRRNVGN